MPTIAEIRQQYPQYDDLSDEQLAQGLHQKYYSDLPYEDFQQRIGMQTVPQEPPRTAAEEMGRAASVHTGAALKGAGGLVLLPLDLATSIVNVAQRIMGPGRPYEVTMDDGTTRTVTPSDFATPGQRFRESVDAVFGAPETPTERMTTSVTRALGGAGAGIGTAIPVLAASPGAQAAGAVGGGSASQAAAEAGLGPVAQLAAGIAGGAVGAGGLNAAAGGVRRAYRGGEAGRVRMEENIRAFEDAGTTPSVGQATQRRSMQAGESLLSKTPGSAGRMASKAERQAAELGAGVEKQAARLSPRASAEQAGRAIERGVRGEGGFVEQFKAKQGELYNEVDKFVQPQAAVRVDRTMAALKSLNEPIKGAENTSKFFMNAKMRAIEEALGDDIAKAAETGALPYEAVKKLRTLVGNEMADSTLLSDVPRSKWKALYGALTSDMEGAAKSAGPQATAAWTRANSYTRAGMRRLEQIDHVIEKNGGPEAIFSAATSGTKEGATTLRAVMQSLPRDAQQTVSATVLRRLGRATPGRQDDLGERFSTETFLTNWNSMSPQAKAVLFDRYGERFRQNMDQIARVASNLRDGSQVFRNPSGTAQATAQTSAAVGFVAALASGHVGTATGIAGGVATANLAARLMTNPRFVKWLATSTKAPAAAAPALLNQLAQSSDDPDIAEFISLQQAPRSQAQVAQ